MIPYLQSIDWTTTAWAALWVGLPALTFLNILLNRLTWPTPRVEASEPGPRTSVLIPARNEEAHIEACVRSVAAQGDFVGEIVVCNDHSTDRTGEILAELQREIPHLQVITGPPLPPGWVGKPHACHKLAQAATGELWMYVDADTRLKPGAVARVHESFRRHPKAGIVTLVPHQIMDSRGERLLMPLLYLTYLAWLPMVLVYLTRNRFMVAANGQCLAITPDAYRRVGGFEAIATELVDDMALCRLAKIRGVRVLFGDGSHVATCRMYGSGEELVNGFSKNLYEGTGNNPVSLLFFIGSLLLAFVVPYLSAPVLWLTGSQMAPWALAGLGFTVTGRLLLDRRIGAPLWSTLLHPLAVLVMIGVSLRSWMWARKGTILWKGRAYANRRYRADAPTDERKEVAHG